jgi:DNA polymerase II small subunit
MSKNVSFSSVPRAIEQALAQGYQFSPAAVKFLVKLGEQRKSRKLPQETEPTFEMIVREVIEVKARRMMGAGITTIEITDLIETFPQIFELEQQPQTKTPESSIVAAKEPPQFEIEIIKDPSSFIQPTGIEGFPQLFKSRYEKILRILAERPEGRQLTKVSRINRDKGNSKVAGLVFSRKPTKNGIEFTLDDDTGNVSILALSPEAKKAASEIALDQCVIAEVEAVQGRLILKSVIQPDIPLKVASMSKKTVYAVFLSDLHIGSNKFLEGAFNRFLDWIAGRAKISEEDEEIVRRLKYVVIGGDVVDGVGVFPNQEFELSERDVYRQYGMVSQKLKLVPKSLQMFVIPGNHDATRQALPQPMIPKKYASSLYELENLTMMGDPCFFKLNGVSILAYHGRSLDDVLATTPGLSYQKPEDAMKVLLRARHLAPIFGLRTPIAPEIEDHLVIEEVPDIFHAGHVHTVGIDRYKSTLIINSGTWQAQTGYQANLGISPRPGLVPIVNLATLEVTLREFLTSSSSAVAVS